MKIVEVISSLESRGGAEVFLISLIKNMQEKNEVYLVSIYDGIDSSFKTEIDKYKIKYFSCHKRKKIDFKAGRTLKRIIDNINPDIINFHLSFLATYYLAFGMKKNKWKLIETFHSIPGHDISKINNYLRKKYIKRHLLSFIGISDQITDSAIKKFGDIDIKTIYNGIEIHNHEYSKQCSHLKEYDFICVANMLPVKNHSLLIETFKLFLNRFPNSNLLLVGGGPLLDTNKNLSLQLGISDHIFFSGFTNNPKQFYEKSRFFVLTSKREGNPISILEAMSYGLPIIAPKVGGIPDIVKDGQNGKLFDVGSKEELLNCLSEIYTNKNLTEKISKNNVVESNKYSINLTSERYIEYFNHIIS